MLTDEELWAVYTAPRSDLLGLRAVAAAAAVAALKDAERDFPGSESHPTREWLRDRIARASTFVRSSPRFETTKEAYEWLAEPKRSGDET